MGIEFIISNNTIVLGQRKEQSGALSSPRGPAGRGWQADEAGSWDPLSGAVLARHRLRLPRSVGAEGAEGAGGQGEAAGPANPPPAEAVRGGVWRLSRLIYFWCLPLQPFPEGCPKGWTFTLFRPSLQLRSSS